MVFVLLDTLSVVLGLVSSIIKSINYAKKRKIVSKKVDSRRQNVSSAV